MNKTLRDDFGGGQGCRWTLSAEPAVKFSEENVEPDSDALSADVYTGSGTVERVGSKIQTLVEERGYTSDSISLEDDFSSPMNEDKFADVSYEWQGEIDYERYDTATESDQRLDCKPNQPPYSGADEVDTCTIFNFHDWSDLFTIYK